VVLKTNKYNLELEKSLVSDIQKWPLTLKRTLTGQPHKKIKRQSTAQCKEHLSDSIKAIFVYRVQTTWIIQG